jgi:NitT/TauT family transport system substrate-binding protein
LAQAATALHSEMVDAYAGYDSPDAVISVLLDPQLRNLTSPLNNLHGMIGIAVRRDSIKNEPKVVGGLCRSFYTNILFAHANPEQAVLNHYRVRRNQGPSSVSLDKAFANGVAILQGRESLLVNPGDDGLYGT